MPKSKRTKGTGKSFTNLFLTLMVVIPLLLVIFFFPSSPSAFAAVVPQNELQADINPITSIEASVRAKEKLLATTRATASILAEYPHDSQAFTQGLVIYGNSLYESTGLYGQSTLRQVDLATGNIVKKVNFPNDVFAEGITILNNSIYVLTWQNRKGYVYDLDFKKQNEWTYKTEGWGITNNDRNLIMSDGSSTLYFINPRSFKVVKTLNVQSDGKPVRHLNELEYINGFIYANIWYSRDIAIINPQTGAVVRFLDCNSLPIPNSFDAVLNGIAFNNNSNDFYLTGKLWSKIYKVHYDPVFAHVSPPGSTSP